MTKIKRLSTLFALQFTRLQLRLFYRHILHYRQTYFYHLTTVFRHISRLSRRQDLLEHQLNAICKGD